VKALYKPLGLIISIVGGLLAKKVFDQIWKAVPGTADKAPKSTDPDSTWKEIAIAAVAQGAIFGVVKALVNRAGAKGFEKATGTYPA
jgi:Protein of unknown function (DUF4235)